MDPSVAPILVVALLVGAAAEPAADWIQPALRRAREVWRTASPTRRRRP